MVAALVAGFGLLLLLGLLARWFSSVEPQRLLKAVPWLVATLASLVVIGLVVTGRGSAALGALLLLSPFLRQIWRKLQASAAQARWPGSGQSSTLTTRTLRMSLDHATGDLDGEVIRGAFTGQRLSELSLHDLLALMQTCAVSDTQSLPLLEAFADRRFPDWREASATEDGTEAEDAADAAAAAGGTAARLMSRADAYRILGLPADADDDAVRAAHRRLIKVLHPDHGGSSDLAAQVNRARDLLLGNGKRS